MFIIDKPRSVHVAMYTPLGILLELIHLGIFLVTRRVHKNVVCRLLPVLGLLFDHENGGSTFHRNVGEFLPDYIM
jgi:hypothetical protein